MMLLGVAVASVGAGLAWVDLQTDPGGRSRPELGAVVLAGSALFMFGLLKAVL